MKFPALNLCLVIWLFTFGGLSQGLPDSSEGANDSPPQDILIEMRCILLLDKLAIPLVHEFHSQAAGNVVSAETKLEELLARGDAKLLGWPLLITHAGEKGSTSGLEEVRFPTEYEAGATRILSREELEKLALKTENMGADLKPVASSFATQTIGISLEAEATPVAGSASVVAQVTAKHEQLKSYDRVTIEHEDLINKRSEKVTQEQPRFSKMEVKASLTIKNGEQRLIGVFRPPGDENQLELFILGVQIRANK